MATRSSVLAWRIPRTEEPGGLPSMGSHRIGHDLSDLAAAAADLKKKNLLESQMLCLCCRNSGNHILPSEHTFFKLAAKLLCSR